MAAGLKLSHKAGSSFGGLCPLVFLMGRKERDLCLEMAGFPTLVT